MDLTADEILNGIVSLATTVIYAIVARLMWRRPLVGDARVASRAFGVFWGALAVLYLIVVLFIVPHALGLDDLALTVTFLYVALLLIVAAIWGLLYYLVFVYTGSARLFAPIALAYGILGVLTVYLVTWMHPIATDPALGVKYEHPLSAGGNVAFAAALILPALAAVVLYATLYFRATRLTERFRIGLVSLAFLVWFGWSMVSSLLQLQQRFPSSVGLRVVNQAFALAAPVLVLVAYRPPKGLRRRFGVHAVDETPSES